MHDAPKPPPIPTEEILEAQIEPEVLDYAGAARMQFAHEGIWREGNLLVTTHNASLPPRCVLCNAGADGEHRPRTYYWHHPALLLMIIFPGLLIYAIVALCVRKKAVLDVGLCQQHRKKRTTRIALAWLLALLGVASLIAGPVLDSSLHHNELTILGVLGGVILIIVAIVVGFTIGGLKPKRMDHRFAWFTGCSPAFLAELPGRAY
jgi:hypothetical protein